ncbi:hypothetical protein WR25_00456 isoform A [Diploscapter pachys]|uniref:Troponin T n=3 Tax=Diploscapter pachys TaxID=2018661 RepID=A0A2A2J1J0_9BILA|nr:hypothetical protein WR25_00456 isoform A [Diploscapter pachys]
MSDDEEIYEEEEEIEEEVEEEPEEVEDSAGAAPRPARKGGEGEGDLNEAEKAMLAAKRRHEDEAVAKLMDYEERRKLEREKEEEELRKLKEKQEKRRQEREQEEREMAERKRQDEERRRQEEEARRERMEAEKKRKEEEKLKKQAQLSGLASTTGGRNFVIEKKEGGNMNDKFGNIVQAKQEMGMTKEQQEEAKENFLRGIRASIPESSDILPNDMKAKIKELHQKICKLEAQKYDSEKRHERQEYDLKELNERQRQVARSNAQKKGGNTVDDTGGRHPPKVQVVSKYDRQIDRRNFKERRAMYENRTAHPVFPGLPPPPTIYEKVIKKLQYELDAEAEAEAEAAIEEEYDE